MLQYFASDVSARCAVINFATLVLICSSRSPSGDAPIDAGGAIGTPAGCAVGAAGVVGCGSSSTSISSSSFDCITVAGGSAGSPRGTASGGGGGSVRSLVLGDAGADVICAIGGVCGGDDGADVAGVVAVSSTQMFTGCD